MSQQFQLVSPYQPSGDQPQAIAELVAGLNAGMAAQTLLGATGTGKTYTVANVIQAVNKPTLVLAHNKTLAGQLYGELKEFFPNNAVEYFVSYYDYYQPEAYVPASDTYIEKESSVNEEIERLRHSATSALLERRDVIVVASVSCIYGLVNPEDYRKHTFSLREGQELERNELLRRLVDMQFQRNDIDFRPGTFRVRGDVVEIFLSSRDSRAIRVSFFGDEIDSLQEVEVLTGEIKATRDHITIFPAAHFVTDEAQTLVAVERIKAELAEQLAVLRADHKLLEAQRLEQRTTYDIEMLLEMGYCSGIENYSRHMDGRSAGEPPYTLLDFFPEDYLIVIDESHITMSQIRGMYNGDRARKERLVAYGFRLPSAIDNRPLRLEEFEERVNQILYISATPGPYELAQTPTVTEQIIRPTGLLDPVVTVRPIKGQIDDLLAEIQEQIQHEGRTFITTLTKKMAEDLTDYLKETGIKVAYLHSDVKTLERTKIIRDLRLGIYDVLVGINLLREGLDVPEVTLVAILDADKEGFLRSERSLVQTIGRAARNASGRVIMYADVMTDSMNRAINETNRRRAIQEAYNKQHHLTPQTVKKDIRDLIAITHAVSDDVQQGQVAEPSTAYEAMTASEKRAYLLQIEKEMHQAAEALNFEKAATLRDILLELSGTN